MYLTLVGSVSALNICHSGVNIIITASLKIRDKIKYVTYNYEGQIKFDPYEG